MKIKVPADKSNIDILCHKSLNRQHEENIKMKPVNTQYNKQNKELLERDVEPGAP